MSVHRNGDLCIIDTTIPNLSSQKESLNNMFDDYIQLIHDQYKQIMSVINGNVRESSFINYSIGNHNDDDDAKQNTEEMAKNAIIEINDKKNEEIINETQEFKHNIESKAEDNAIEEIIDNVTEDKNDNLEKNGDDNGNLKKNGDDNDNLEKNGADNADVEEWMTDDDESFSGITAQTSLGMTKELMKKKMSEYFTPPVSVTQTTRASTRIMSRIKNHMSNMSQSHAANVHSNAVSNAVSNAIATPSQSTLRMQKPNVTPQTGRTVMTRKMAADINASGGSTVHESINTKNCGSSVLLRKHMNRVKNTDTKTLTESAAKKRKETEEQQLLKLQMAKERENRVLKQRQELIQQKIMEKKLRSAEKIKKVTETRAVQRLMEEEKLKEIEIKREETERRLKFQDEKRKEQMMKRQEILMKKHVENEQRKIENEQKGLIKKQDDMKKRHEIAAENKQQNDCIAALIQQHNSSLQQKAMVNSYLKKTNHDSSKDSPTESAVIKAPVTVPVTAPITTTVTSHITDAVTIVSDAKAKVKSSNVNSTFTVPKDITASHELMPKEKTQTPQEYELTPPPKEYHAVESYDISGIKSDDDTDDEKHPSKAIPSWARGTPFLTALKSQFAKSKRRCLKESLQIFPTVQMPVDLGLIFKGKTAVAPRYAKRTSSAVWTSPPEKRGNYTDISLSYSRSLLE